MMALATPNIIPMLCIHIGHIVPCKLTKPPSSVIVTIIIRNVKAFIEEEHNKLAIEKTKQLYANKWISND